MTARAVVGSAPGKLILTGEYAVLDGAPALVAAIDRRATAHISAPERAGMFTVHAADLDLYATGSLTEARSPEGITSSALPGQPDLTGVRWDADARTVAGLSLITHVLEHTARRGPLPPCTITLSTAAFFDGSGAKLGLGSSAALTVALAGALAAHAGQPAPTLAELIDLHRAFQGGRGSGADIAASYTGGIIRYRTGSKGTTAGSTPATLPGDIAWAVVFTGRSASTAAMLTQLEAWRAEHPRQYRAAGARLAAAAEQAAGLCRNSSRAHPVISPTEFLAAIDAYADALDALGAAANLDIISADHRRLRNLAADRGVIYKPSGAGGGDIGIAFAGDADHIARFRDSATAAGYRMIEVDVDDRGLAITDG